jgi:hypothetical protein
MRLHLLWSTITAAIQGARAQVCKMLERECKVLPLRHPVSLSITLSGSAALTGA